MNAIFANVKQAVEALTHDHHQPTSSDYYLNYTSHEVGTTKSYADHANMLAGFRPPPTYHIFQHLGFSLQLGDLHFQRISLELSGLQR